MADDRLSKLLETQISLTEWLAKIGHADAEKMREEDNIKRVRIGQINDITGMPYDKPTTFDAMELVEGSERFKKFLTEHGDELCALRLIPKKGIHAEKLRNRGLSIKDVMTWFEGLDVDMSLYDADFIPHFEDYSWATIFVVNDNAIFGEINKGGHHILTQGFHSGAAPIIFSYDFKKWTLTPANQEAEDYLKKMTEYVHVPDPKTQTKLSKTVGAEFAHDYMKGYFETAHSDTVGTWFIDYNRLLGKRYEDYVMSSSYASDSKAVTKGRVASQGDAEGLVRIITDPASDNIGEGEILVCVMTTPDFIPHMVKAAGIVTDQGGILCHAAIVARELGKPCIVGTGNATSVLKNGYKIRLDTKSGDILRDELQK